MLQTLKNAWKTQELKTKLLFTLLIVILYRLGSSIPVPWINSEMVAQNFSSSVNMAVQMIAGDAFAQANLFALSVSPYITSSIIIQLLTVAIPALERLAKEGEEGKKKINMITRCVTMGLALVTAFGYSTMLITGNSTDIVTLYYSEAGAFQGAFWHTTGVTTNAVGLGEIFQQAGTQFLVMIACYCAGAALVMWLAEKINEHGIGNGISVILLANIVVRLPSTMIGLYNMVYGSIMNFTTTPEYDALYGITTGDKVFQLIGACVWSLFIIALLIALVWVIVWFTDSERRIPVQYAKKVVGRKMYGGQSSNLPLKLNMAGVMPVIFANSIVSIPATLQSIWPRAGWINTLANGYFNYTKPLYVLLSVILLFAFAYFYILISFNPVEVANNIRNNGGAVPGIRPGKPTSDYIRKILNRITFIGAVFLCIVSELPKVIVAIFSLFVDINSIHTGFAKWVVDFYNTGSYYNIYGQATHVFMTIAFSGTSVLIVVGVILETVRELEAQLTMRNYKGFLD